MPVARFLQVSDFHLGRGFGWLPQDRRALRRQELRRALEASVTQAIERGAHAILIPGDLFDVETPDADTLSFAIRTFEVAGCPPVFIAPGNHDPASPTSHAWNPGRLAARGFAWAPHVHVFTEPAWTSRPIPGLDGVTVWGRCFASGTPTADRPLEPNLLRNVATGDGIHVAVFHGSREGFCPPGQKITGPFSDGEALRSRFAWIAAGHYHAGSQIDGPDGPRLAYSGSPVALDMSETGRHGACDVQVRFGDGLPRTTLEFVELDTRRVYDVSADVTGAGTAEQVDRRALKVMDQAGATEQDFVTVRLAGRLAHGVRYGGAGPDLRARAFHVRLDRTRVRPEYDLEALRGGDDATTESRFVRALLEQHDAEKDPEARALIESALYYGLDALKLGEVAPAYEELAE